MSTACRLLLAALLLLPGTAAATAAEIERYVRYARDGAVSYGRLDGNRVLQLSGPPYAGGMPTGSSVALGEVRLLAPVVPGKVLAVGLNYRSHAGESGAGRPRLFLKLPSSIVGPEAAIELPADAENAHYEGEMVVVIGRRARNLSETDVLAHVFGVTAGNDVSERSWQGGDLQWWRAKAADTFGPLGPVLVRGLDYGDLLLTTRLNGEVVQQERTASLIHDVAAVVAHASRYVTLEPGDAIFTGTPGRTRRIAPGDVVEVELEGVGTLRNPVVRRAAGN